MRMWAWSRKAERRVLVVIGAGDRLAQAELADVVSGEELELVARGIGDHQVAVRPADEWAALGGVGVGGDAGGFGQIADTDVAVEAFDTGGIGLRVTTFGQAGEIGFDGRNVSASQHPREGDEMVSWGWIRALGDRDVFGADRREGFQRCLHFGMAGFGRERRFGRRRGGEPEAFAGNFRADHSIP